MLKTTCINPEIMKILSLCGHGDKVLIADGNYPLDSKSGDAGKVYLGLTPGIPSVTDVLAALNGVANFEKAEVMLPDDGSTPEIFVEFTEQLGDIPLDGLDRCAFYDACCQGKVRLAVLTGEQRVYANILLTIGVV